MDREIHHDGHLLFIAKNQDVIPEDSQLLAGFIHLLLGQKLAHFAHDFHVGLAELLVTGHEWTQIWHGKVSV